MDDTLPIKPQLTSTGNSFKLDTQIRVRWLAVAGQTAAVLIVAFALEFQINTAFCLALIACSAWLNVFLGLRYRATTRLDPNWAVALLGYDILQLSALLFATGGLQNPFSLLLVAPVVVCSTIETIRRTLTLAVLAIACATFLIFFRWDLPWFPGQQLELPRIYVVALWIAIVFCIVFTAAYAFRVADEARKLSNALTATELVLQREQHLSVLDGLAAAAAHELGTPLATISLVSKEMTRELPEGSPFREDAELLLSQAARCREIMQKLSDLSKEGDQHIGKLKLSAMMEEIATPHRNLGVDVQLLFDGKDDEPVIVRNPGILYGLGSLMENAVDFATEMVIFEAHWDEQTITMRVSDDGPGFAPEILLRIGDPFMTTRPKNTKSHGGGLGLGLFIAKTLLERSGATIEFSNAEGENQDEDSVGGAEVMVRWERKTIGIEAQSPT